MSVYTSIDRDELSEFLANYRVGGLQSYAGIPSGIENTNYYVTTDQGEYVLTIFEQLKAAEIPFFLDLTAYLAEHDIPCAHPIADKTGKYLGALKRKPTALAQRLRGKSLEKPEAAHCLAVGEALARLNHVGQKFPQARVNPRGPLWWKQTAQSLDGRLSQEDTDILKDELRFQSLYRFSDLPRGIVHADLFRDNVLFEDGTLFGLIDFYYACTDVLLFDVAVTINDWCGTGDGALNESLARPLLTAYHKIRVMTTGERDAWPVMLRAASLRFWLSRLYDLHFPRPGEITHTKDPDVFKRILVYHIDHEYDVHGLWPDSSKQRGLG